jgi:hypothetical protein
VVVSKSEWGQNIPSRLLANIRLLKFVFMGVSELSVADLSSVKPVKQRPVIK